MVRFALLVVLLVGVCWPRALHAKAPVRSVDTIAWAIGVDHGHIPLKTRRLYAKALRATAKRYRFDAFTAVSLVRNESHWRPQTVGDGGIAIGLAQIQYTWLCKNTPSSCKSVRQRLFDPVFNIKTMGRIIDENRKFCRRKTGKPALWRYWLPSYGGYNRPRQAIFCNQKKRRGRWVDLPVPRKVRGIMAYRRKLIRLLHGR